MKLQLPEFLPAQPSNWLIGAVQSYIRFALSVSNRLHVANDELEAFAKLPPGAGVVLVSNHADETDPLVCLELARRIGRRFILMCNREAFDELGGFAGLLLQRLGYFSVKRGAHDSQAKQYAIKTVEDGKNVLVIFPEGEIYYLNDLVQKFHSGAIDISLQAITDKRKEDPQWTSFIVPMVIKYHYKENIETELEKRITKMEARLLIKPNGGSLQERLTAIQDLLITREDCRHEVQVESTTLDLTEKIIYTEQTLLTKIEQKYEDGQISMQATTIDQVWQLQSQIREGFETSDNQGKVQLEADMLALQEVAQLSSWKPSYWASSQSLDRLAEAVLKTERELYKTKRPKQLANRQVIIKLAEPINMGAYVREYLADAHSLRHGLTNQLHEQIQQLVDQAILQSVTL